MNLTKRQRRWRGHLVGLAALSVLLLRVASAATLEEGRAAFDRHDFPRARSVLLPLAQEGIVKAQVLMGRMALEDTAGGGASGKVDTSQAVMWFQAAAQHEDAEAEAALANLYRNGLGIPRDFAQAFRWYGLAANHGSMDAAFELANMHYKGEGTSQDYAEALHWYRVAADARHGPALFKLGLLYQQGQGTQADPIQAYVYLTLASENGVPKAQKARADLAAQLAATERAKAEHLLAEQRRAHAGKK